MLNISHTKFCLVPLSEVFKTPPSDNIAHEYSSARQSSYRAHKPRGGVSADSIKCKDGSASAHLHTPPGFQYGRGQWTAWTSRWEQDLGQYRVTEPLTWKKEEAWRWKRSISVCAFLPSSSKPHSSCDTSVSAKKEFRHCTHAITEVLKFGHLEHYLTSSPQTGNWTGYTQALYCINMTKEPVNRAIQCPTNKIN